MHGRLARVSGGLYSRLTQAETQAIALGREDPTTSMTAGEI